MQALGFPSISFKRYIKNGEQAIAALLKKRLLKGSATIARYQKAKPELYIFYATVNPKKDASLSGLSQLSLVRIPHFEATKTTATLVLLFSAKTFWLHNNTEEEAREVCHIVKESHFLLQPFLAWPLQEERAEKRELTVEIFP